LLAPIKQMSLQISGFMGEAVRLVTSREKLAQFWHVPLYANTVYLMAANFTSAILTFGFWIMAARFYSPQDVGVASAAIAAVGLLTILSNLGLGMGLIRFLPGAGKDGRLMINTVFTTSILVSIIAVFIFLAWLGLWSPALLFIRQNPIYFTTFVLFTIAATLWTLMGQAFVAERRTGFILAKNLIFGLLRLPLLIILAAFFHFFGIFASWSVSLWISLLLSIFLFLPRAHPGYRPSFSFKKEAVKKILRFSFANYLSMLFVSAPGLILPIIVLNLRGAEFNAFFYIAWSIVGVLNILPDAPAFSLFAEGSYDEKTLQVNTQRALKITFLIMVPTVILILAIADKILLVFGNSYSQNASTLLRILTIAALPLAINIIYLHIKRVEKNLRVIVVLPLFSAIFILTLSYVLLPRMGNIGIGIAWLTGQTIIASVIVIVWLKGRRGLRVFPKWTK
jgi:O-antigen/teichoic acid export membrane protein